MKIDADLLKKEINRLYQEHSTRDYCDEACSVLDQLENFIDSHLEEQTDCEDKTADELAYEEYLQGIMTYEDYCAVCDIEECEPEPPLS